MTEDWTMHCTAYKDWEMHAVAGEYGKPIVILFRGENQHMKRSNAAPAARLGEDGHHSRCISNHRLHCPREY